MESNLMALLSDVIGDQIGSLNTYKTGRRDLGSVSGAVNLDLSLSNDFTATVTANTTFTIINTPSTGVVSFSLQLQGGGAFTITFANAKYPAATAPSLTSGTGIDVITFITYDNGTNWRGTISMKDSR
jgi:hypothetical protein